MAEAKTLLTLSNKNASSTPSLLAYYQALTVELNHLQSLAFADAMADGNQVLHYLNKALQQPTVVINAYVWNVHPSEAEKNINDPNLLFPFAGFLKGFLLAAEKRVFVLPLLLKQAHFVGMVIAKIEHSLAISYFNPSGTPLANSGEDQDALQAIHQAMDTVINAVNTLRNVPLENDYSDATVDKITAVEIRSLKEAYPNGLTCQPMAILSDQQQINGSDCGYIVSQTLVEIASGLPLSIQKLAAYANLQDYAKPIAQARANFCHPKRVGEDYAAEVIRDQALFRLGKALSENNEAAQELRAFIKQASENNLDNFNSDILLELDITVKRLGMRNGFKGISGLMLADHITNYLKSLAILKNVELTELKAFCDQLLEPYVPDEYANVRFRLNQQRKKKRQNTTDESLPNPPYKKIKRQANSDQSPAHAEALTAEHETLTAFNMPDTGIVYITP